jgi:cholesterol transport system auxiliary component
MSARRAALRQVAAVAIAAALGGCSSGLRSDDAAPVTYVLRAPAVTAAPSAGGAAAPLPASVLVARIAAHPGYDGDRIVLLAPDRRLDVYAGSRWPAPAPDLVGALVVDTLRASGRLRAVHDDASPFTADYTLRVTIRRFDADYTAAGLDAAPRVVVTLDGTLGRRVDRGAVATFVAEAGRQAASNRMSAVVAAFDEALQAALGELAERSIESVDADLRTPRVPRTP